MNRCVGNDDKGHNLTPIYWLVKGDSRDGKQTRIAKNFMCKSCLRLFHLEEITERDSRLKMEEMAKIAELKHIEEYENIDEI
jgi:hypothetical protein